MLPHTHSSYFNNKRVVVMGLGRFGGGIAITRWLVDTGADVIVTDQADPQTLTKSLAQLDDLLPTKRLSFAFGSHEFALLEDADVLVVNPAVAQPWDHPFICEAHRRAIEVTTEIEIAYRQLNPARIIAITGSAGKSTTSAMIHHVLLETGHDAILGGNIGGSLLSRINEVNDQTIIVLELSSAMIYWLWGRDTASAKPHAPAVAAITNYTPNHLDWHGGELHYQDSKKQLIAVLPETSTAILGPTLENWKVHTKAITSVVSEQDSVSGCLLPGKHNAINAAMALRCAAAITRSAVSDRMIHSVRSFHGLPHRLNRKVLGNGLVIVNDSKSTVPEATLLAVDAVAEQTPRSRIHLICGGSDKGSDLSLIAALHDQLAGIYTIGTTGKSLANGSNAHYCETLERAVEMAIKAVAPGDTILLSPGCASWDQFTNYEQRGERFVVLATQLANERFKNTSCSHNS